MGFDLGLVLAFAALLLGFGFVIFVHELGHFLVAKWVGIKCTQFAIGFGHAICTWRKGIGIRKGSTEAEYEKLLEEGADPSTLGETEYRFNWLPLGGYVKMLGQEDMDPAARSDDPRSYNNKSVAARMAVISAGVVMNLIFGLIFFIIAFSFGVKFPPPLVGIVNPGSPAAKAQAVGHENDTKYLGLQPGDEITHIDGEPVADFMDIKMASGLARSGQKLELTVKRVGEPEPLTFYVTPEKGPEALDNILWIGLGPSQSLEIGKLAKGGKLPEKLQSAGVVPGMKATKIDGDPISFFFEYDRKTTAKKGDPVVVTFASFDKKGEPAGESVDVELQAEPQLTRAETGEGNLVGIVPAVEFMRVIDGTAAKDSGVQDGDVLSRMDTVNWPDYNRMRKIARDNKGKAIALNVLRKQEDGTWKEVDLGTITPDRKGLLGFQPRLIMRVAKVLDDSPLASQRIPLGSKITSINDQPVASLADMQRALSNWASQTLANLPKDDGKKEPAPPVDTNEKEKKADSPVVGTIKVAFVANVGEEPQTETAEVEVNQATAVALADSGWSPPYYTIFKWLEEPVKADGPVEAMEIGVEKTGEFMFQTYLTLARLIQGDVPAKALRGPVGIAHIGTQIAYDKGWTYLLFFLGLISVNLVVINFLPIPIVDGGHMVFLIIEKLKGSPVSVKVQTTATLAGLVLIASLFLFVTYNDIVRLF